MQINLKLTKQVFVWNNYLNVKKKKKKKSIYALECFAL